MLGFSFSRGLLCPDNRQHYLDKLGLSDSDFSMGSFHALKKITEAILDKDDFVEYEMHRINVLKKLPLLNYPKTNEKTRSFIHNNCFEKIDQIVVLPLGTGPNRIGNIARSDECSLLLSRLDCSQKYNINALVNVHNAFDVRKNDYMKSSLTYTENDVELKRMLMSSVMEVDGKKIAIIDRNRKVHFGVSVDRILYDHKFYEWEEAYNLQKNYSYEDIERYILEEKKNTFIKKLLSDYKHKDDCVSGVNAAPHKRKSIFEEADEYFKQQLKR